MRVVVFCSCSADVNPMVKDGIRSLGRGLARDGHSVVFGGSSGGCMGALADGVLEEGGRLVGVVPEMDFMDGRLQPGLSERVAVKNLSARKDAMVELGEAFVVCPGGLGTLDEAFAVLALKSCGALPRPVVFFNYLGMWEPTLEALDLQRLQKLIRHPIGDLLVRADTSGEVRRALGAPARPRKAGALAISLPDGASQVYKP